VTVCEKSESLEKNIHYLVKIVRRLSKGKSNFESVLASQNYVFGKSDLGFIHGVKRMGFQNLLNCVRKSTD